MLQGMTVPPGFSGCSSFPGLLLKANLSWIYAGLNPPFLLRVGMPMQCMHSAILLWKIRPSVRPSVDHILVLYRNECAIVKLFPASGRDVTPVFSSINAVTKFQSFHGGGKKIAILDRNRRLSRKRYETGPLLLCNTIYTYQYGSITVGSTDLE